MNMAAPITRASLDLVRTIFPPAQSIRLVGVAVSNFDQPSAKAELPLFGADQTGDDSTSSIQIIDGKQPVEITTDWIIINFEILAVHANRLILAKADTVIVDEAHELRNRRLKRFAPAVKIV
jgi:hypothetical protein